MHSTTLSPGLPESTKTNPTLVAKFHQKTLRGREWLCAQDMECLVTEAGLKESVIITELKKESIEAELKKIPANKNFFSSDDSPDQISFLFNAGEKGTQSDNGTYWIPVFLSIARNKKEVIVNIDSRFSISAEKLQLITSAISSSLGYKSIIQKSKDDRHFDEWESGYWALKEVIDRTYSYEKQSPNETAKKIKNNSSIKELQKSIYYSLLKDVSSKEESKYDKKSEDSKDEYSSLKKFIDLLIEKNVPLSFESSQSLQDIIDLEEKIEEQKRKLYDELKPIDQEVEIKKEDNDVEDKDEKKQDIKKEKIRTLVLDAKNLFSGKNEKEKNATLVALARYLTEQKINKLTIENAVDIPKDDENGHLFEDIFQLIQIDMPDANKVFKDQLEEITARNRLIKKMKLAINPEENVWQQLAYLRFVDGSFYGDRSLAGVLNIFPEGIRSTHEATELIQSLIQCGNRFFSEFLNYLHLNEKQIKTQGAFPYEQLVLNNSKDIKNLEEYLKEGKYFPFPKIYIKIKKEEISDEVFDNLLKILSYSTQYPDFQQIHLEIFSVNKNTQQYEVEGLTKIQYEKLKKIYLNENIVTKLTMSLNNREESDDYKDLMNQMAINIRNKKIKNRSNIQENKVVDDKSDIVEKKHHPAMLFTAKKKFIRTCKLKDFNYKKNLHADISVEQQLEKQHQQQAQLQQETQQNVEIQASEQDEISNIQQNSITLNKLLYREDLNKKDMSSLRGTLYNQCLTEPIKSYEEFCNHVIGDEKSDNLPNAIKCLTPEALNKILSVPQYFLGGLNIDNLPLGFYVEDPKNPKKSGLALCFDLKKSPVNKNVSPLTPNLKPRTIFREDWMGDYAQFNKNILDKNKEKFKSLKKNYPEYYSIVRENNIIILESRENKISLSLDKNNKKISYKIHKNFDKSEKTGELKSLKYEDIFNRELVDVQNIDETINDVLKALVEEGKIDGPFERFNELMKDLSPSLSESIQLNHAWYFKACTFNEYNLLIEVLYYEGCEGLNALLNALKKYYDLDNSNNKNSFHLFRKFFIRKNKDAESQIADLTKKENLTIISKLGTFTREQDIWWNAIVENRFNGVGYVDLEELYNGFTYFLSRFPKDIEFPSKVPLKSANPLVELDRLLFILSKVPLKSLPDQIKNLGEIDLSQEGAWYAARWDGYHYFHPDMKLKISECALSQEGNFVNDKKYYYKIDYISLAEIQEKYEEPPTIQTSHFIKEDKKVSNKKDLNLKDLYTAFHRYVGGSKNIAIPYQSYVNLINSFSEIKDLSIRSSALLPLLAVATTGSRGVFDLDVKALFQYIDEQAKNKEKLILIFSQISEAFKSLGEVDKKPNLKELTGLIKIFCENEFKNENEIKKNLSLLFKKPVSEKPLQAFSIWDKNKQHVSAYQWIKFIETADKKNKDQINEWIKIGAILKNSDGMESQIENLFNMNLSQHEEAIRILSTIDIDKTSPSNLPTIKNLIDLFKGLSDKPVNTEELPKYIFDFFEGKCAFNYFSERRFAVTDNASLLEGFKEINSMLSGFESKEKKIETQIDLKKAAGVEGPEYLQKFYKDVINSKELIPYIIEKQKISVSLDSVILLVIKSKFKSYLNSQYYAGLNKYISELPLLKVLLMKQPEISGNENKLAEEIKRVIEYTGPREKLFSTLIKLKNQWGSEFAVTEEKLIQDPSKEILLKTIINSPYFFKNNPECLNDILESILKLELPFNEVTKKFLKTIFPPLGKSQKLEDTKITENICLVVSSQSISMRQKIELIDVFYEKSISLASVVNNINYVSKAYPEVSELFFKICIDFLSQKSERKEEKKHESQTMIESIITLLKNAENKKEEIISLYKLLFNKFSGNSKDFNDFLIKFNKFPEENKNKILKVWMLSTSNDGVGKSNLLSFLDEINQFSNNKEYFERLVNLFDTLPYPGLDSIKLFFEDPKKIQEFEIDPSGKRSKRAVVESHFDIRTIRDRIDAIVDLGRERNKTEPAYLFLTHQNKLYDAIGYITAVGKSYPLIIPEWEDDSYRKPCKELKTSQIKPLIQHYRKLITEKKLNEKDLWRTKLEFAALIREALYRATGDFAYDTQMLAVMNVVLQGGNIFSEVRTGEGKSILTAFMAAFKWAEGGAVDVCSSNIALADRDLKDMENFFNVLGIKTALIKASSSYSSYEKDGINYSEIGELSIFQEKQMLEHNPLPENVSLILDEADFSTLDNMTQFRFAIALESGVSGDVNPYENIYPMILRFVEDILLKTECTNDEDIENLKKYAIKELKDPVTLDKFLKISNQKLDRWINAAFIAIQMKKPLNNNSDDYSVREDIIEKKNEEGVNEKIKIRRAVVKVNHRDNPNSRFSDGVHQFLHTLLNREVKQGDPLFLIEPEKSYLASRTVKNTLDYYLRGPKPRGNVIGLTGTIGTPEERAELNQHYKTKFFKIPPHHKLLREDQEAEVAKPNFREPDKEAHFRRIYENAIQEREKGKSILIICKGVVESQELNNYFEEKLKDSSPLTLFNGEQSDKEKDVVKKAGEEKSITISTPMFGRGTDIKLLKKYSAGLHVIHNYISDDREYGQTIGRSGRKGQKGSSKLILSQEEFTKRNLKVPTRSELPKKIHDIRLKMNKEKSKNRYEHQRFSDIKDQVFKQYTDLCRSIKKQMQENSQFDSRPLWEIVSQESYKKWEECLRLLDEKWAYLLGDLRNQENKKENEKKFDDYVDEFAKEANEIWKRTSNSILFFAKTEYNKSFPPVKKERTLDEKHHLPVENKPIEFTFSNVEITPYLPPISEGDIQEPIDSKENKYDKVYFSGDSHLKLSYLKMAKEKTSLGVFQLISMKKSIMEDELDRISKHYPELKEVTLRSATEYLLKKYYSFENRKITNFMTSLKELEKLIFELKDEAYTTIFCNAFKSHIEEIQKGKFSKNTTVYLSEMQEHTRDLIKQGFPEELLTTKNDMKLLWESIYGFLEGELKSYKGSFYLFTPSNEEKLVGEFKKKLKEINTENSGDDKTRLNNFIQELDKFLIASNKEKSSTLKVVLQEIHDYTKMVVNFSPIPPSLSTSTLASSSVERKKLS